MKIITNEQVKALLNDIYRLNPPIQVWEAFNKFFQSLPDMPNPKEQILKEIEASKAEVEIKTKEKNK